MPYCRRACSSGLTTFTADLPVLLYERMERWSQRLGLPARRSHALRARRHAERRLPDASPLVRDVTDSYVRYRLAGRPRPSSWNRRQAASRRCGRRGASLKRSSGSSGAWWGRLRAAPFARAGISGEKRPATRTARSLRLATTKTGIRPGGRTPVLIDNGSVSRVQQHDLCLFRQPRLEILSVSTGSSAGAPNSFGTSRHPPVDRRRGRPARHAGSAWG